MRRKRRNHSPAFKAKVALAALQGDRTLAQLAEQFELHPNQIQTWKKQLSQNAEQVFASPHSGTDPNDERLKELHAKIGQLTMEKDFLSKALGRTR